MAKHYTFTAAIRREGKEVKQLPGCVTFDGYLCRPHGRVLKPVWDGEAMKEAGKTIEDFPPQLTIEKAIAGGFGLFVIRFGKQDSYWVWNVEAAEREKIEAGKTVFLHERDMDGMGVESEIWLSEKPYPKGVLAAMMPHLSKGRRGYEVVSYSGLKKSLEALGWWLNR